MKKRLITYSGLLLLLLALTIGAQAQNERKFIRRGNELFEQAMKDSANLDTANFNKAEIDYRKALDKRPDDLKWNFNLGDALYKQKKFKQATTKFEDIAKSSNDKIEKAKAYHNIGNSLLMQNKLDESIEAYKNALRNNPKDLDSKYNLIYAMDLKKKKQQQKKKQQNKDQNKKNKDKNKDQNKNKQDQNKKNQDQNKKNQDQNKKDQNKNQQNKNQNQQQKKQQQQPQKQKISKENAERLLQALQNDEQKVQEKVRKAKAAKAQQRQIDKNW